jgi:predicted enzyme related to lactoylglutathione lyase
MAVHIRISAVPALPRPAAVLFVSDVAKVARFYREAGAMARVSGDDDHEVLESGGFELVVHRLRGEPPVMADAAGRVPVREDSYHKLCLPVASIAQARRAAASCGGHVKDPRHEWSARGFRACDGHDPEGNVVQLREAASAG